MFASVIWHGAVGDGIHDDTAGIQAALNLGNIIVPAGTYLISSQLSVPSNRTVRLLPGAVFLRAAGTGQQNATTLTNANFWMNSDPVNGNSNITIEGGCYDGNQANQTPVDYNNFSRYCGGVGMRFLNVTNLAIRNIRMQNNISFQIQIGNVTRFSVENVQFVFSGSGLHQDGVHVNGPATIGVIRDIQSNGGNDSMVALNADDAIFGKMTDGGDISNVLVENLSSTSQLSTPYEGSAVMLLKGPHNISDVIIRGVHGKGFQANTVIDLESFDGVGADTGSLTRVVFEDFDVGTPCVNDGFCQIGQNAGDITFRNCRWYPGSASADSAPTVQSFFRQVGGTVSHLVFDGVQIIGQNVTGSAPFEINSVGTLIINNTMLTRSGIASPSGVLVNLTGFGVNNMLVNGVVAEQLSAWSNGTAAGVQVFTGLCSNPVI